MMKQNQTDTVMHQFSFGEVGLDADASPGNGAYYLKHYASGLDLGGYDTLQEALNELEYIEDKDYR
jgi:hypothetical protein